MGLPWYTLKVLAGAIGTGALCICTGARSCGRHVGALQSKVEPTCSVCPSAKFSKWLHVGESTIPVRFLNILATGVKKGRVVAQCCRLLLSHLFDRLTAQAQCLCCER